MMKQQKIFYVLLILLFVIAPLYTYPNMTGIGLNLPFNIAEWVAAVIFMCSSILISLRNNRVRYNKLFLRCLFFLLIICILSVLTDVALPNLWLFRLLTIAAGFLFIAVLFQIKLSMIDIERALYIIIIAIMIHTFVGILQVIDVAEFARIIPRSGRGSPPIGIFQQVNLLATYLVTGLVVILFLISRPSFSSSHQLMKVSLVVTFGLAVYIILATGSRIGLISLLVSLPVMVLSRRKQLFNHKHILLSLILVTGAAVLVSAEKNTGLERTMTKIDNLLQGEYKTYREGMYKISIDLIKQKPLLGHGMTSFPRVWTEQKARFIIQNPKAAVSPLGTGHPHNEILLWLIEGGVIAGLGLLIVLISISQALYRCGVSRGGAYIALLLPISLHTQTAWPFYGSAVHWFLWLFIIYMVFRHQVKTVLFDLSLIARYFLQVTVLFLGVGGSYFLWHTNKAHDELYKYMNGEKANMQLVLENQYFSHFAEKVLMQSLLYSSIEKENMVPIPNFIIWAEGRLKLNAEPGMFIMLNDAYDFVGETQKQCRIAIRGVQIYPDNHRLQQSADNCP